MPQIIIDLLKKFLFGCKLILISIRVTTWARTINITAHSTVGGVGYRKLALNTVQKLLLWQ